MQGIAVISSKLHHSAQIQNTSKGVMADALSRKEIDAIFQDTAQADWNNFAKTQQNDYVLKRYLDETDSPNVVTHEWQGIKLLCDGARDRVPRPLVPCGFRRTIFLHCQNLTHSGIRVTIKFMFEVYTWPTMKKHCTTWVQSCIPCQQTKVRPYTKSPYQHYPLTSERLSEIHLDLIGPLPESEGNRYILIKCVDRYTRWFTASALPRQDVQTVISAFLRDWVSIIEPHSSVSLTKRNSSYPHYCKFCQNYFHLVRRSTASLE